jgi:two-component system nitrogen regulation response regulator NtrX
MKSTILIVDDEPNITETIATFLEHQGYTSLTAQGVNEADDILKAEPVDAVVLDVFLRGDSGLDYLTNLLISFPSLPVILISGQGNVKLAVQAVKAGAFDFLEKPIDPDRLLTMIKNALQGKALAGQLASLKQQWITENLFYHEGGLFHQRLKLLERAAKSEASILIFGENGSGKELAAKFVHLSSQRAEKKLVTVNCAAIPTELYESELFGHVKGAFTGALHDRSGYFREAEGGTLFLDEIGEIPMNLQAKLLRVLENGEIQPVGAHQSSTIDVRIIAATNRNLEEMIEEKSFRQDLYFRLNQIPVHLPALRERREEIPALANHFLREISARNGLTELSLSTEAMDYLMTREYKGNIREFRNLLERAAILSGSAILNAEDLQLLGSSVPKDEDLFQTRPLRDAKIDLEREFIRIQLEKHEGSIKETAQALEILPNNLSRKMKELGL